MRLALALLLATLAVESAAQPSPAWTARIDGAASYYDRITDMKVDRAGDVYLCGSTYTTNQFAQDYLTVKYGPDGTRAWARIFDVGENDIPAGIALDPLGNVYVTGSVGTLRYDSAGTQQWHRPVGGSAIATDPSGNLLLAGSSGGDAALWKLNQAGDTLWMRTHDGPAGQSDYLIDVASDAQGNVVAIGAQNLEHDQTVGDFLVLMYDPAGSFRWAGIYDGPGNAIDLTQAFALDSAGNVVVAGWVDVQGQFSGGDVGLVRFRGTDGSVLSSDTVDRGFQDRPFDVALDAQGNAYVVGHTEAFLTLFDYIVVKFDAGGQEAWTRTYDGGGRQFDEATAVSVDRTGHIYVTGGAAPVAGQPPDFVTLKYHANGTLLWAARYDSPAHDLDTASHMEVDGMGNIYVAGESYGVGTQSDFLLVKYAGPSSYGRWSATRSKARPAGSSSPGPSGHTRAPRTYLGGTRLPAIQTDSMVRVLRTSSRGLRPRTTKSAHAPGRSVPAPSVAAMHWAASRVADWRTWRGVSPALAISSSSMCSK